MSVEQKNAIKTYAQAVREMLRSTPTNVEQALAPIFKNLVDDILPTLPVGQGITTVPEYANDQGRPDIAFIRAGQRPKAFIELKAPDKRLDPTRWRGHDKSQFERFSELPIWALTNFIGIRFYQRDEGEFEVGIAPSLAFEPTASDARADGVIDGHDIGPFVDIINRLAQARAPSPANAAQLAEYLAHAARLVRASVIEKLGEMDAAGDADRPLQLVREEFRNVLYAHPESGGYRGEFNTLFSAAFAQTLAFGLLLVREATGQEVDRDAWRHMPDEHPLMKTALRVLSEDEIVEQIRLGFDVMFDTINGFDPRILIQRPGRGDPILYFYEDFLTTFDADAKQRYGVYYTPVEVVRYMVGALDRALREHLGTEGLTDRDVTILDPATGTGTFLLGIAERVREKVEAESGPGAVDPAMRQLAERMYAFELLIGPYAVAHYRLHHALAERPSAANSNPEPLPRLGIYLADTLARPGTSTAIGPLGYTAQPIQHERDEADRIKAQQQILAIIGNPPYWRFQGVNTREVIGPFIDDLWDDLKEPVRQAGWANQLNTFPEFSVAFWRWAIWKLFEADNAPQRGVIAFITNRTFLAGKPYAGLRKMLRERFDRIEIIDLRGNVRQGERADILDDEGVFNIQVGTAITLAVADGSLAEGELAEIVYVDSWERELYSRRAKLDALEEHAEEGRFLSGATIARGVLDNFRPVPFQSRDWPSIEDCFAFKSSGLESKRDHIVYAPSTDKLERQIRSVLNESQPNRAELFNSTGLNPVELAVAVGWDAQFVRTAAYRPFDRQFHYRHDRWNDRPRPNLSSVWGTTNVALFVLPNGTNAGPASWCYDLYPDRHSFRGSYGGYAFPLYDRRPGHGPVNLLQELIDGLSLAYREQVTPEQAFDAMLGLLSATSYTLRFAEDLEDVFPHIPFPADKSAFDRAVAVGKEIRDIETFARSPGASFLTSAMARIETTARGPLAAFRPGDWDGGELTLCADGTGRVSGIPRAVWEFAVSGYRVLPRWLAGREGIIVDDAFIRDFRDITGRINELIHRFDEADLVLQDALNHTLTKDELGL